MPYFGNNPSPLLLNTVAQNGKEMTLDADADTSITADTDDQIDIKIGGADDFQFTANTFTAQSGSTIAAQALTATTITASGIVKTDDTTDATSTTDGSLQTDGGLSVAKDVVIGDDLKLLSDAAVLSFGADSDVTLTHVADTGLLLNSTMALQFNDASQSINAPSATVLDINATDEIELNATAVDLNGTLDVSGTSNFNNNLTITENNPELFLAATVDGGEGSVNFKDDEGNIDGKIAYRTDYAGQTDNFMTFNTAGSERVRITSDGNIGVGTTSPNSGYRIHALNSSGGSGILAEATGTGNESYYQLKFVNSSGTSRNAMIKGDNGDSLRIASANAISIGMETSDSQALSLGTDGSLRLQHVYDDTTSNSANMYIHSDGTHQVMRSTSSERYKKDIETLEDKYADAVLGLRPVWYKSKCEVDNPDFSHWGLIAEEVAKVDPRLVTFRNEYTEDIGDGKWKVVKLDAPQPESVQYDRLVPHLINICKRQEDKITALEAKVKTLEEA